MTIKEYLNEVLNQDEIINLLPDKKAHFLHAKSPKEPYIEYEVINESGNGYAENREINTSHTVQVDIFSYNDYSYIENVVYKKMIDAGFSRDTGADLYESDTKYYHKAMRFKISLPTDS